MGKQRKTLAGEMLRKRVAATVSPAAAGPGWASLSEHFTQLAEARSPRDDLNVICAPEAALGHPGYYMAATARIALNGEILPDSPDRLDTDNPDHFKALASLQGVFVHELGHAVHSDSMKDAIDGKESAGATLLEEIRMEARAIEDRPKDATWIRAAAQELILKGEAGQSAPQTKAQAVQLSVLTEGRVKAGSLKEDDVKGISDALESILDQDERKELEEILQGAVDTEDGQIEEMTDLARRLRELAGEPEGWSIAPGENGAGEDGESPTLSPEQAEALKEAAKAAADNAASEAATELIHDAEGSQVDKALDKVEESDDNGSDDEKRGGLGAPSGDSMHASLRDPDLKEKQARNRLSQLLRRARFRDRDRIRVPSNLPPGRLRTREAMRGSAEKAMGRMPSAKPWKKIKRKRVEQPKLRVGLVVDVSGSMGGVIPTVSSTMWVVANAVHDVGGRAAGYSFGDSWNVVVEAQKPPRQVTSFGQGGGTMNPGYAIQQAERDLDFDLPGPRVLVIVSDGAWAHTPEGDLADQELKRLIAQGVVVLSVNVEWEPSEHPSSRTCVLDAVEEIPEIIGGACLQELQSA